MVRKGEDMEEDVPQGLLSLDPKPPPPPPPTFRLQPFKRGRVTLSLESQAQRRIRVVNQDAAKIDHPSPK